MKTAWVVLAAAMLPFTALAHGFEERYDLPAPLAYFVIGAAATVALSFLVAVLFARGASKARNEEGRRRGLSIALGPVFPMLWLGCRVISLSLFILTLVAALWGTADPMMNLAPTLVWIIWWVGLSLFAAFVGNIWPALDPWRTLFDAVDAMARRLGRPGGIALGWRWPSALGVWPAVVLLLLWGWLEVVYPIAAVPLRLGHFALAWSAVTLCGMLCFGRQVWQQRGDVFAIYFATLGRLAPLALNREGKSLVLRPPGAALICQDADASVPPAGTVPFVIAMLSTVLFDGLHGGSGWLLFERYLSLLLPQWMDINGYFAGSVGLLGVWLVFFTAFELTCIATAKITREGSGALTACWFIPALVPIAAAYNLAHNFSSLLIQGQNVIALISDPLGRHWDLLATAALYPDMGLIDARWTWYVAIGAIVTGHVISVWLAHRIALRNYATQRTAVIASVPLTALMIAYTAVSLSVIAEPMVTFY
jgi:hypothetical protein